MTLVPMECRPGTNLCVWSHPLPVCLRLGAITRRSKYYTCTIMLCVAPLRIALVIRVLVLERNNDRVVWGVLRSV